MPPATFKAAILDMDGVITQTARVHARAWKEMFDEFLQRRRAAGQPYEPFDIQRDYRQYVDGKPRYDGVRSFLASRGIELPLGREDDGPQQETVCGLGNRKNQVFLESLRRDGIAPYDDAVEQIGDWKRRGMGVAVISSSRNCEDILAAAGVLDLFDVKVDGNDLAPLGLKGKPAPDVFLHAAEQLGVAPPEALVVEDAISGIEAGCAGGFGLVVGVARKRDGSDLRDAGADRVVHDLRELRSVGRCEQAASESGPPLAALAHSEAITEYLRGKDLALFLDYDGTLTPIVRRPEDATLAGDVRALLVELARHATVAIVSGRDRRDVEQMVGVESLVYAGSHGFDIRGPHGLAMEQEAARKALPELDGAEAELVQRLAAVSGARIERKKFAVAVHYRELASHRAVEEVERVVDEVLAGHPGLRKRGGKKIFELQPDIPWDKGYAVTWLSQALGLDRPDVAVIYIGDDLTDEDAFRALARRGAGIGILVGSSASETSARYTLNDCGEVKTFLQSLLAMLEKR